MSEIKIGSGVVQLRLQAQFGPVIGGLYLFLRGNGWDLKIDRKAFPFIEPGMTVLVTLACTTISMEQDAPPPGPLIDVTPLKH